MKLGILVVLLIAGIAYVIRRAAKSFLDSLSTTERPGPGY